MTTIRELMVDDGEHFAYRKHIKSDAETVSFSKSLNGSVIGSIHEFVMAAEMHFVEGDMVLHDVGFKLNDPLLSAIAAYGDHGYGKPKEAFKRLASKPLM